MKWVILLFLLVILYCLGSGVFFLVGKGKQPEKLARALTWRIGLSFTLFMLLFIGYFMGWLHPHAL